MPPTLRTRTRKKPKKGVAHARAPAGPRGPVQKNFLKGIVRKNLHRPKEFGKPYTQAV